MRRSNRFITALARFLRRGCILLAPFMDRVSEVKRALESVGQVVFVSSGAYLESRPQSGSSVSAPISGQTQPGTRVNDSWLIAIEPLSTAVSDIFVWNQEARAKGNKVMMLSKAMRYRVGCGLLHKGLHCGCGGKSEVIFPAGAKPGGARVFELRLSANSRPFGIQ